MKDRFNPANMSLSLKLTLVKATGAFFALLLIVSLLSSIFLTDSHVSYAEFNQVQNEYLELEHKYDTLKEEVENIKTQHDSLTDSPGGHIDVDLPHPGDAGE